MARRIFVAGHRGMVGQALSSLLQARGDTVLKVEKSALDLRDQSQVTAWLRENRPDAVLIAAARVGGIQANMSRPADFIYDNLAIAANLIHGAHLADIDRLVYLGSSCIYPRLAAQPIGEEALLTGPLEPTNEWYAIAKIAGIKLTQAYRRQYGRRFIAVMPCNLYGPGDNFDLETAHVLPALMRKFHQAKLAGSGAVVVWGSGAPLREFLHVTDLASAVATTLDHYDDETPINCGAGEEISILGLARLIGQVVGFEGDIVFDSSRPDGTPRKLLDSTKMRALGWEPRIPLPIGIAQTYAWFQQNFARG